MDTDKLSSLSEHLISALDNKERPNAEKKLSVNPVVSKLASWYEKLRNAMEYGEEEVVLRGSIERILKRRLFLGRSGQKIALPLVRELLWAKYFPEGSIPESITQKVAKTIDLHLQLQRLVLEKHGMHERDLHKFILHLLSSDIEYILNPNQLKNLMANYMYQTLKSQVVIEDDSEQTKDVQVYIAVRRNFAKDDKAFLTYHLFTQYFGGISDDTIEEIAQGFMKGYHEIEREFAYPLKEKLFAYVKAQTPVFLILQDVLLKHKDNLRAAISEPEALSSAVMESCNAKYESIGKKVRTAIVRSILFILCTKVLFAFFVEGSYEKFVYGHIVYRNLAINTIIPPFLMVIVALLIKTPGVDNSKRILGKIQMLLFTENPQLWSPLVISKKPKKRSSMDSVFTVLWVLGFIISFGGIWFLLGKLQFNYVSRFVFLFFLTIVSFLSYRINQTAHMYSVENKQGLTTPVIDFLFLPVIQVGRRLTEGVSQINFVLFIFDFLFETPFKGIFAFFEQWFHFLHQKRENLE